MEYVYHAVPETEPKHKETIEKPSHQSVEIERVRVPRRIIHFSDGVIEEYSTDEEEEAEEETRRKSGPTIDPRTLGWMAWAMHYTWRGGSTLLAACDAVGERIAWWAGITSPKYYAEIREYLRQREIDEKIAKRRDEEERAWRSGGDADAPIQSEPAKE